MAVTVWPVNAIAGAPAYSARLLRQTHAPLLAGATSARPLGARSGVRPGTPSNTVTVTSSLWTLKPHAGILDVQTAVEAGAYCYAIDANETGAITAAHATLARVDVIGMQVSDPPEDGTALPLVAPVYVAGTAGGAQGVLPARSMLLGTINIPASGGGSPTFVAAWPLAVAAGGIIPVRTQTELDALGTTYASTVNPIHAFLLTTKQLLVNLGAGWLPLSGWAGNTGRQAVTVTGLTNVDTALTPVITVPALPVPYRVVVTALGQAGGGASARQCEWDFDSHSVSATTITADTPIPVESAASKYVTVVYTEEIVMPADVDCPFRLMSRTPTNSLNAGSVTWIREQLED